MIQGLPEITLADLDAAILRKKRNRWLQMFPDEGPLRRELYPKHMEYLRATKNYNECAFIAGNRTGKSETMVYAITCFLTGQYPPWWEGRVFPNPVNVIVAGETAKLVRDSLQEKFLGAPSDIGTGMIPYDLIIERKTKPGIPDAIDTVRVRHVPTGGVSVMKLMSYDQGREAFQATSNDVIGLDEEPPMDIYSEAFIRTMTKKGLIMAAFTPLRGISEVVLSFMPDDFGKRESSS